VLRCGDDFASKHPKIATMFGLSAETKRQVKQIVEALLALFVAFDPWLAGDFDDGEILARRQRRTLAMRKVPRRKSHPKLSWEDLAMIHSQPGRSRPNIRQGNEYDVYVYKKESDWHVPLGSAGSPI
jgi:hypothetical protein